MARKEKAGEKERIVVAAKGDASAGDAARICIRRALFEAWAELYGGRVVDGRGVQMLFVACPDGDAEVARERIIAYVPVFSSVSPGAATRMRDGLVARAREEDMAGMGMSALTAVLDRLGGMYDVVEGARWTRRRRRWPCWRR